MDKKLYNFAKTYTKDATCMLNIIMTKHEALDYIQQLIMQIRDNEEDTCIPIFGILERYTEEEE